MLWRCPREQGTYPHVRHIFLGGNTWYPKFYPWTYSNPASREYIYLPPMQKKKNYLNPDILMCLDNLKSTFNTMMISFSAWRDHLNSPILMSRVPNFHHKRIFSARCKRRPAPCLLDFGRTGPGYQPGFVWLFFWGNPLRHPMANRQFPMTYAIWEVYPLVNVYITMENHHAIHGKTHYFYGHFQ